MPLAGQILLTLACALAVGLLLERIHMPGGMMIGAVIGACALEVFTNTACMPAPAKTLAQIIAGAFIGSGIERESLREMKKIVKPALILLPSLLAVNIAAGFLIHRVSSLDLLTALMCAAPGGISDIPMIAADMGADPSVVVVMQFVRLLLGIGVFPLMIRQCTGGAKFQAAAHSTPRKTRAAADWKSVALTLLVATVCGLIGKATPIPAGTMGFATLGSIVFACVYPRAHVPRPFRKGAQLLSGAYVGAGIGLSQLRLIGGLGLPALVLVAGYTLSCFCIGFLLTRAGCFTRREGMLAATPAGASDMALISADLGVENPQLIVLQVLRLISVVLLFPSALSLCARLLA